MAAAVGRSVSGLPALGSARHQVEWTGLGRRAFCALCAAADLRCKRLLGRTGTPCGHFTPDAAPPLSLCFSHTSPTAPPTRHCMPSHVPAESCACAPASVKLSSQEVPWIIISHEGSSKGSIVFFFYYLDKQARKQTVISVLFTKKKEKKKQCFGWLQLKYSQTIFPNKSKLQMKGALMLAVLSSQNRCSFPRPTWRLNAGNYIHLASRL